MKNVGGRLETRATELGRSYIQDPFMSSPSLPAEKGARQRVAVNVAFSFASRGAACVMNDGFRLVVAPASVAAMPTALPKRAVKQRQAARARVL